MYRLLNHDVIVVRFEYTMELQRRCLSTEFTVILGLMYHRNNSYVFFNTREIKFATGK